MLKFLSYWRTDFILAILGLFVAWLFQNFSPSYEIHGIIIMAIAGLPTIIIGLSYQLFKSIDDLRNIPGLYPVVERKLIIYAEERRQYWFTRWIIFIILGCVGSICGGLLRFTSFHSKDILLFMGYIFAIPTFRTLIAGIIEYKKITDASLKFKEEQKKKEKQQAIQNQLHPIK